MLTVTAKTDTDGAPGRLGPSACVRGESDDSYGTYSSYAVSSSDQAHVVAAPGTCAGLTTSQIIAKVRADAASAATTTAGGFAGDPLHPLTGRYYGYLVSASVY